MILAVTFVPSNRTQNAANTLTPGGNDPIAESDLTPEAKLAQLVEGGYDAFAAQDFEKAEQLFLKARQIDEGHDGATFGWIRANFHLGNVETAERAAAGIFNDGTPEKAALSGLCHAGIESHSLAILLFKDAIAGGLDTREVLTNLGYSLYRSGKYDEAIEVLEESKVRGGDPTIANVLQVLSYSYVWQRRGPRGKPIQKFDEPLIASLLAECRDVPAKFKVASDVYIGLAHTIARKDAALKEEWMQRSFAAFRQGLEVGLDPANWNGIKNLMSESILQTEEAKQFTEQAAGRRSTQHRTLYLLDPLVGTRFDRWTERKLTTGPIGKPASLVASNAD